MKHVPFMPLLLLAVFASRPLPATLVDSVPLIVRADSEATVTLFFENEPLLATPGDVQVEYVCADGLDAKAPFSATENSRLCPENSTGTLSP